MTKIKNEAEFYRKLARQKLDKYTGENLDFDENNYLKIIHTQSDFAPRQKQSITSYITELKIRLKLSCEANHRAHVDGVKGPWYTHLRDPRGCFMCNDINALTTTISAIELLSIKYPKLSF